MSYTIDVAARNTAFFESAVSFLGWRDDITAEKREAEFS